MAFNKNITVVKIGGNVIDNEAALNRFVEDFAQLPSPKGGHRFRRQDHPEDLR